MSATDGTPDNPSIALAAALKLVNRMLKEESWARETLAPHVGKRVRMVVKPLSAVLAVVEPGYFAHGEGNAPVDLVIDLPGAALWRVAAQPDSLMSVVKLDGDAAFAEALSQLARHLRPDVEEALSRVLGDVAAMRVVGAARGAARAVSDAHQRLAENVAEYFLEENRHLVRPREVDALSEAVRALRDDLARLEKRIERLAPKA